MKENGVGGYRLGRRQFLAGSALASAGLDVALLGDAVDDGPFALRHASQAHPHLHVLCGLLHPRIVLPGLPGRWPGFWLRPDMTVLPAFSEFTGGVLPRLAGRDDRDLLGAVEPPEFDPLEDLGGFHGELRGEVHRQLVPGVVLGERAGPAAAGQEAVQGGLHVSAERGRRTHPGHDDPPAGSAHECEEM